MKHIRAFWPSLTTALALTLFAVQPADAQIGVAAGLNFNELDDIEAGSVDATFDNATGYHFGAFLNLGTGGLSLRPGVFYHRIGTYDFPGGDELELSAIEVPVDVRVTFGATSPLALYVLGGPVLTFPRDDDGVGAMRSTTLTADLGVGLSIGAPGGPSLQPELRYSVGVTDYLEDEFTVGGATVTPADDTRRLSKLMLRLNVVF
jgi:hypothetical protein